MNRISNKLHLYAVSLTTMLVSNPVSAVEINLYDWGFNIDNAIYCKLGPCDNDGLSAFPSQIDATSFDYSQWLGTLTVNISGEGSHYVGGFFDFEIDESINTFFNESGSVVGATAAGQSWEIDEPGYVFGDIFSNFLDASLDNMVFDGSSNVIDDVALSMAWDFSLSVGEFATVTFVISDSAPNGFYLQHSDPDSNESIYLSSSLKISAIPEPEALALFSAGLLGFAAVSRRNRSKKCYK